MNSIPEGMSWQESRGTPNPATDMLNQLKRDMADKEFGSPDEINNFVRGRIEQTNQAPLNDFLGISPNLMHRISSLPLYENQDYLSLTGKVLEKDIPDIPILRQSLWLLNRLNTGGSVKLTAAGYLPPSLALEWFDEAFRPFTDDSTLSISPVRRESDDIRMVQVRDALKEMKLLYVRKGQLGASTKGKAFLKTPVSEQYRQFFYFLADEWDWSDNLYARFEVSPFHQNTLPFFLHVMNTTGPGGITETDVKRVYTAAFPHIFDTGIDDPFVFFLVLIEPVRNFTEPLGLSYPWRLVSEDRKVVPTGLFGRALRWGGAT